MKFLIFNILVFFALGYLLTSNSNQNFKSWFSDKKDQITNLSKKDYVDKLKTAVSSNSESSVKTNLSENKINNEGKFQKEMLTQIKKLNDKINKNIKDLSKPEKKISQDNVLSKGLNNPKGISNFFINWNFYINKGEIRTTFNYVRVYWFYYLKDFKRSSSNNIWINISFKSLCPAIKSCILLYRNIKNLAKYNFIK